MRILGEAEGASEEGRTDMTDQFSLFPEQRFWIPEVDNDCRMWKCPECGKRMGGQPLEWYQFNYYRFCPYCGTKINWSVYEKEE